MDKVEHQQVEQIKVEFSGITLILQELHLLRNAFNKFQAQSSMIPRYYNKREACELKGVNYNTTRTQHWSLPKGGRADKMINGSPRWSRETIQEWLEIGDEDFPDYLRKYNQPVPKKAIQNAQKAKG